MAKQTYAEDLKRRLNAISGRISEMEIAFGAGSPEQKVKAAGDLEVFKMRRAELVEKLQQIENHPSETWGTLHTEIAKDVDAFSAELERFILHDRRFE